MNGRNRPPKGPKYLYRYLPEQYARALVENGIIKITTLSACRKSENPAQGDDLDGAVTMDFAIDDIDDFVAKSTNGAEALKSIGIDIMPGSRIGLQIYKNKFIIPDKYMLCTSMVNSRSIADAFGADSCVQIRRPGQFIRRLTQALGQRGYIANGEHVAASVVYYTPPWNWEKYGRPDARFCKREEYFGYQSEFRMVWTPKIINDAEQCDPFIFDAPSIKSLCKIVDIAPDSKDLLNRMPTTSPGRDEFGCDPVNG